MAEVLTSDSGELPGYAAAFGAQRFAPARQEQPA
jgi:glycine oxidase